MLLRAVLLAGLLGLTSPLAGQRIHRVVLQNPAAGEYRFLPARLTVGPSDVIEFTVESGGPYVVGFLPADLSPADQNRLQAGLPGASGALRGPVLEGPGAGFRVGLPGLPAGTYRFQSVTHASYRMEGAFTVR